MAIESTGNNIDRQQERIKTIDKKEGGKTDIVFKRLDDFQKSIESSKAPPEVKAKQLKELGDLLATANTENIKEIDKELDETLTKFEDEIKSREQTVRLQQCELITHVLVGISELFKDSGGVMMKTLKIAAGEEGCAQQASRFANMAENFQSSSRIKILDQPDKSLEELFPDVVQMLNHTGDGVLSYISGIPNIDFTDHKNAGDLNSQRAQVMKFLESVGAYKTVEKIGQEALKDDFDKAKEKTPEAKKTEITEAARAKIAKDCEPFKADWKAKGMSDEQINGFIILMQAEQVDKDLTTYAIKENFNPDLISEDKKAAWAVYNDAFDPKGEWLNITDDHFDFIVEELLINAPLIVLSGGIASAARGALSAGARSFLAGSRLAMAYEGGNLAVRGAALAGGLLVEGATFELAHNTLSVAIGIEDKWLIEMPDAMQKILWSSVTLGVFHGAGELAGGIGKQIDLGIAKQFVKNPEEIVALAAKISDGPTRKVIQQLVISGNIEAGTMLLIGAVQNGFHQGSLQAFTDSFGGEEIFHAYVSAYSLKAGGMAGEAVKNSGEKMAVDKVETKISDVEQNASLPPEARLAKAQELLGKELSPEQQSAILKAHEVGSSGEGKFTKAELLEKARILDEAGFTKEERRVLMENGITGIFDRVLAYFDGTKSNPFEGLDKTENLKNTAESKPTPEAEFNKLSINGKQPPETINILKDGWFKVEHKERIGDHDFYFGPVVNRIEGGKPGRPECIAFVKIGEVLQPRLFYLSNSDGGWRASPYVRADGRYSKGNHWHYTQETKPAEEIVSYLESAKKNAGMGDIGEYFKEYDQGRASYKSEMTQYKPENLNDLASIEPGRGDDKKLEINKLSQPELIKRLNEIKYPDGFVPDFANGYVHKYTKNHTMLGEGQVYVYEANLNGRKVEWHMATYGDKVCVEAIRFADAKITSFGNYNEVISSGILTTKPIEYRGLTYGGLYKELGPEMGSFNSGQLRHSQYVDQSPLLNQLKPIQDFRSQFVDKIKKAA